MTQSSESGVTSRPSLSGLKDAISIFASSERILLKFQYLFHTYPKTQISRVTDSELSNISYLSSSQKVQLLRKLEQSLTMDVRFS
jgi:hypothetical protein